MSDGELLFVFLSLASLHYVTQASTLYLLKIVQFVVVVECDDSRLRTLGLTDFSICVFQLTFVEKNILYSAFFVACFHLFIHFCLYWPATACSLAQNSFAAELAAN